MLSVTIAKSKLPIDFIQNLYSEFNERTCNKILSGMIENRYTTLRANTIKTNITKIKETLNNLNIENGEIYLQSLSSMIPPIILNPKSKDNVLDLTASPGSKTTQMGCLMENKGYILANEIDKIRCNRLKYNIEKQGIKIAEVSNKDGRIIGKDLQEKFDKVLLDVPCSGEGRFLINNPNTYNTWSEKQVKELINLQKELFESGYCSLKKGGTMVYSTCTLNKLENENIIDWAIKKFNLEILNINIKLKETIKPCIKGLDKNIDKAIKILPSKTYEGFFVCLLRKN